MTDHNPTIRAMLGPDGPQVSCDACFRLLDEYVDLERAGHDAAATLPAMATHLIGCPVCAEEHRSLLALVETEDARS
jgi:hypothetical protein